MVGSSIQHETAEIVRLLRGIEISLLLLFSLGIIWFGVWLISVLAP